MANSVRRAATGVEAVPGIIRSTLRAETSRILHTSDPNFILPNLKIFVFRSLPSALPPSRANTPPCQASPGAETTRRAQDKSSMAFLASRKIQKEGGKVSTRLPALPRAPPATSCSNLGAVSGFPLVWSPSKPAALTPRPLHSRSTSSRSLLRRRYSTWKPPTTVRGAARPEFFCLSDIPRRVES